VDPQRLQVVAVSAPFDHDCAELAIPINPCRVCGARQYACTECGADLQEFTDHDDHPPAA